MISKEFKEFYLVDTEPGWVIPLGYPRGIEQKILAGTFDEARKSGTRTSLLRFQPGTFAIRPFFKDYWQDVYLISGDLAVGNDVYGGGGEYFALNAYQRRPPGLYHGPFKSEGGCVLLEIHFYA